MPSYVDQLYGVYYSEYSLYHHGIKGQKWGVRRFQNEDGTRTAAGKLRASEKTGRKIDKLQAKIDKSDSNAFMRNTINDNRRGKIGVLKSKQAYQKSKEDVKDARAAYKANKTAANKKALRAAKSARSDAKLDYKGSYLLDIEGKKSQNNILSRQIEGRYDRARANGDSKFASTLKATGAGVVTMAALYGAKKGGIAAAKKVGNAAFDAILNTAVRNAQMSHIPRLDSGMITNFKYSVS